MRLASARLNMLLMLVPIAPLLVVGAIATGQAQADPIRPAADGTNTRVDRQGDRFDITGGQRSRDGANLFHSFSQFGLNADQIANFVSNPSIHNILGRINGGDPSIINGLIQVTGGNSNLYLLNPSGILFGANASLNLPASFTATTATGIGFDNGWFNASGDNQYANLVGTPQAFAFNSADLGSIVNAGQLAVGQGQDLALIGGTVVNTGSLSAPGGNITVMAVPAAADGVPVVRISQTGNLLSLDLQPATAASGIASLPADFTVASLPQLLTGGDLNLATGLTVNDQGQVVLTGANIIVPETSGTAIVAGSVDVSATQPSQVGGSVQILGDQVGLLGANVNASGTDGGGTVLIGGEYQGGGTTPTADRTYISSDSIINADSLLNGDGGRVIAWADQTTQFYGSITAQGGSNAGNGGFVEVSGRENLGFDGEVNVTALNGDNGILLLDPASITIVDTATGVDDGEVSNGEILFADRPTDNLFISQSALEALLPGSDLTLQADTINFNASNPTLASRVLNLQATTGDTVTLNAPIGFTFNVAGASDNPGGRSSAQATIATQGGDVVLTGGGVISSSTYGLGRIVTNGGDVTVTTTIPVGAGGDRTGVAEIDTSNSSGNGGNITINDDEQRATIGGYLGIGRLNTSGSGDGGDITVTSNRVVFVNIFNDYTQQPDQAAIESRSTGSGQGGDVTVRLVGNNRSGLFVLSAGLGAINTSSENGNGGNVDIQVADPCTSSGCTPAPLPGATVYTGVSNAPIDIASINTSNSPTDPFSPPDGLAGNISIINVRPESPITVGRVEATGIGGGNVTFVGDAVNLPNADTQSSGNFPQPYLASGVLQITPITTTATIDLGVPLSSGGASTRSIGVLQISLPQLSTLSYAGEADSGFYITPPNRFAAGIVFGGSYTLNGITQTWTGNVNLNNPSNSEFPFRLVSDATIRGGGSAVLTGRNVDTNYTFTGSGTGTISSFNDTSFDTDITTPALDPVANLAFEGISQINAGTADDTFVFQNNSSTFNGAINAGTGNNTLDFSGYTNGINANLNPGGNVVNAVTSSSVVSGGATGITSIIGGSGNDTLIGNDLSNVLIGNAGDDTIDGGLGDDVISGGTGSNSLIGGLGLDRVVEGDRVLGGEVRDASSIDLINRNLTFTVAGVPETTSLNSDIEAITLIGSDTANTFTVDGWSGVDATLIGNGGDDTFTTLNITGRVDLDGGSGSDTYRPSLSGTGTTSISDTGVGAATDDLQISGTTGADSFTISTGQIQLAGGGQSLNFQGIENQSVNGLAGADTFNIDRLTNIGGPIAINGGDDNDVFNVTNNISGTVNLDGGLGSDQITVALSGTGFGVTNVIGAVAGDTLTINGTATTDTLVLSTDQVRFRTENVNFTEGTGTVAVNAGGGNDIFQLANDGVTFTGSLIGGDGSDTLDYSNFTTSVTADLTAGTGTGLVTSIAAGAIENLTGGSADDTLTGDGNANALSGGAGNDTLNGNAGDDILNGNAGDDILNGNEGNDSLTGEAGTDTFNGGNGIDRVAETRDADFTLTDSTLTIGAEPSETLNSDVEAIALTGGNSDNRFTVDSFTVTNQNRTVSLDGAAGNDTYVNNFSGIGAGTTVINDSGTTGTDTAIVNGTSGNDAIALTTGQVTRGSEVVTFSGTETLAVNAGLGDDTYTVNNFTGTANLDGGEGSDGYTVNFSGTGTSTTAIQDSGTTGTDALITNGTAANDQIALTTGRVALGTEAVTYSGTDSQTINAGAGSDTYTVRNFSDTATLNGEDGSDTYGITFQGTGSGTTTVNDSGATGADVVAIAGTAASDQITLTTNQAALGSETVNQAGTENLSVDAAAGTDTIAVNGAIAQSGNLALTAETITSTTAGTLSSSGNRGITLNADDINLEAAVTANGRGSVAAIATNDINADDITAGNRITLNSEEGSVISGDLDANGRIVVAAGDRIVTGAIETSSTVAQGGVSLNADNNIRVASITTGGGDLEVTTNRLFQVTGAPISISTSGGDIDITYNGRELPANTFRVGRSPTSGTAGTITTGSARLTPFRLIPGATFQLGNITITNLNPAPTPTPTPTPQSTPDVSIEELDRRPAPTNTLTICPTVGAGASGSEVDQARSSAPDASESSSTSSSEAGGTSSCIPTAPVLQVEDAAQ